MPRKATSIRLSDDELAVLRDRAAQCGMTPSAWCRMVSLDQVPRCTSDQETVRQLRLIGHNLNQLTKLAHQGQFDEVAAEDLKRVRKGIDLLLETLW